MKMLTKKVLAAKVVLVFALTAPGVMTPAQAGIPVIDGANLTQTVMSAVENVAQTLRQIEQYRAQLQQYENMIQNIILPAMNADNFATAVKIAKIPEEIRGYDVVKDKHVHNAKIKEAQLLAEFQNPSKIIESTGVQYAEAG